jgi:tetratricopeptide (TPR) repeat protein
MRYDWNLATFMNSRISSAALCALALIAASAFAADPPKKAPEDASSSASRGVELAESGHCAQALPLLTRSVSRLSDKELKKKAAFDGIRCAMAMNQTDASLDFIRLLNREFPNDPEVLYLATHLFSDLSIRASQQLLYAAPSAYQVHELNAEALEAQGKWSEAALEYGEVLKKDPNVKGIHYRVGRLLLSGPKKDETTQAARREFEEELKIDPANAGAEYVLGELARQDQQFPAAIEHFSRATKFDASFADAFIGLGRSLLESGRNADAIAPLQTAAGLQPDNPVTHFYLGTAYRRAGRIEQANHEFTLHQQTSEKARQRKEQIQVGVAGPQQVIGSQKAEPPPK